jgi:hypothetical protein
VQAAQLQHNEEQEEDDGTARNEQVLPLLSQTYGAQGKQIALGYQLSALNAES